MPYVPLDQSVVLWDEQGKPYWRSMDGRNARHYIPPMVAAQYRDDPRMLAWAQSQGFQINRDDQGLITGMDIRPGAGAGGNRPLDFKTGRQWDSRTGSYDTDFDWGDVAILAAGGLVGAGAASALGAAGSGGAAGSIASPTAAESAAGISSLSGSGLGAGASTVAAPTLGAGTGSVIGSGITPALGGSGIATPAAGGFGGASPALAGSGAASSAGTSAALGGTMAPVASSSVPTSLGMGAVPSSSSTIGGGAQGVMSGSGGTSGGSLMSRLLGNDNKYSNLFRGAGQGISGATSAAANNRGAALEAELAAQLARNEQQRDYESQLISRSVDDRASLNDAYKNSVIANRTMNREGYKPAMLSQTPGAAPSALPNFGTGFKAPTAQERGNAQSLYDAANQRLTGGSQLPPLEKPVLYQNDPRYLNASGGEKIGNWLGPVLSGIGGFFGK